MVKLSVGLLFETRWAILVLWGALFLHNNVYILVAEAWSMREGIRAALALEIRNMCIEGDNLLVINSLQKTWKIPWEIDHLICFNLGICLSLIATMKLIRLLTSCPIKITRVILFITCLNFQTFVFSLSSTKIF